MICWLNGAFISVAQARIDPQDRGFLLGDGIFETLLAVDGVIKNAASHLARLNDAASVVAIDLPFSQSDMTDAMQRLLKENCLQSGRAVLRLTLTRGVGARGLLPPPDAVPTFLITAAAALPAPLSMRVIVSSFVRSEKSITARIKSTSYLDNILARREAQLRGADEALLYNTTGRLACASAANLFAVNSGVLLTPAVAEGALPGIMREEILRSARRLNIPAFETVIDREVLQSATEIFLTNALIGVCPVTHIDGRPVGAGETGLVTAALRGV